MHPESFLNGDKHEARNHYNYITHCRPIVDTNVKLKPSENIPHKIFFEAWSKYNTEDDSYRGDKGPIIDCINIWVTKLLSKVYEIKKKEVPWSFPILDDDIFELKC